MVDAHFLVGVVFSGNGGAALRSIWIKFERYDCCGHILTVLEVCLWVEFFGVTCPFLFLEISVFDGLNFGL